MEILLDGIPLDKVSTSMTINSPAAIIWAMYIAAAEKQGVRPDQLRGTIQNDILKEYIAQKEYIFPPEPSMRLVVDTIEFGASTVPAVEHDQHLRLPHPRGRLDRRPGAGLHPGRWHGIRALGARSAAWMSMSFAPRLSLLLQRPQRLLRGDRQVPRRPAHLGARDARDLRRAEASAPG